MSQLTPHFHSYEISCPCCGDPMIQQSSVNRLERARMYAGIPFHINSAKRCPVHNLDVGGKKNSAHLDGYAFDIRIGSSHERFIIYNALVKAGFKRIGIAGTFIHCDDHPDLPQEVTWKY